MDTTPEQADKLRRLHRLKREAIGINSWRERALHRLLTDIAPRINKLGEQFYFGCGVHYAKVQDLGRMIGQLAIDFQPCMNWLEKNEQDWPVWIMRQAVVQSLIKGVKEAEASAAHIKQHGIG